MTTQKEVAGMNWSDEEAMEAWRRSGSVGHGPEGMKAAMAYAVELVAARGGTMTAEELHYALDELDASTDLYSGDMAKYRDEDSRHISNIRHHIRSQVATLQAKVTGLKASLGHHKAVAEKWQDAFAHWTPERARAYVDDCHAALREAGLELKSLVDAADGIRQLHGQRTGLRAEVARMRETLAWSETQRGQALLGMQAAESRLAAIRQALAQEVVQWAAERSWCRRCRTETAQVANPRVPHKHATTCPLFDGDAPQEEAHDIYQCPVEDCRDCKRALEGDVPQEAKEPECACTSIPGSPSPDAPVWDEDQHEPACPQAQRYPCSATCTHSGNTRKERSEELKALLQPTEVERIASEAAEAMHDACRSAVSAAMDRLGILPGPIRDAITSAVDGATP